MSDPVAAGADVGWRRLGADASPGGVPRRIAFLRMAPHPIPNRLLPPRLEAALPGCRVEVMDVGAAVRRDPLTWLVNPLYALVEHGPALLAGRIPARQAFFTTTWMFRRMSRAARRFVERGGFEFSFQIQSLFDGRSDAVPHFVYTDHTHLTNLDYEDFDRRLLRGPRWLALERALYDGATIVFTRSENVSRTLLERYGQARERVVCVGAGSNARIPEASEPGADADDTVRILFVGVDWARKGGPELVEAFRRLRERHPEARLRIVGASPAIDAPGVEVVGRCPVDAVHAHYAEASIFCLPSRREPFGVAYVEALHHGLPVVGTRIGAVPELVEEGVTGFLVDVGDVDALAERLERLVADGELRRSMGRRARARARERYTWESVAARMADSIRAALDGREQPAAHRVEAAPSGGQRPSVRRADGDHATAHVVVNGGA